MENKIYIIGMGPGREDMMTNEAIYALEMADVIIGYTTYVRLLGERFADKEIRSTPMKQEVERCRLCYEEAGKREKSGTDLQRRCRNLRSGFSYV